jgi:hypothetical protein
MHDLVHVTFKIPLSTKYTESIPRAIETGLIHTYRCIPMRTCDQAVYTETRGDCNISALFTITTTIRQQQQLQQQSDTSS